jgi:hypothetical protein
MSIEGMVASVSEVAGMDIDWLPPLQLPVGSGGEVPSSVAVDVSNEEFFETMAIFETDHVLVGAQQDAAARTEPVSRVRLDYLEGKEVTHGGGTRKRQPYRGVCTGKAITTRVIGELAAEYACRAPDCDAGELESAFAGIRNWNVEYLYAMVFHDNMADAWSPLRDSSGGPVTDLQSWVGFIDEQLSGGAVAADDIWKWEMARSSRDGILLSTADQRLQFVRKYGFALFFGLVQELVQMHECSEQYCCAPRKQRGVGPDGKVANVTVHSCRFDFRSGRGKPLRRRPTLEPDARWIVQFCPRRNRAWLNATNRITTVLTLHNSDCKPVCSVIGLVKYIAPYNTKQAKRSSSMQELIKLSEELFTDDNTSHFALTKYVSHHLLCTFACEQPLILLWLPLGSL